MATPRSSQDSSRVDGNRGSSSSLQVQTGRLSVNLLTHSDSPSTRQLSGKSGLPTSLPAIPLQFLPTIPPNANTPPPAMSGVSPPPPSNPAPDLKTLWKIQRLHGGHYQTDLIALMEMVAGNVQIISVLSFEASLMLIAGLSSGLNISVAAIVVAVVVDPDWTQVKMSAVWGAVGCIAPLVWWCTILLGMVVLLLLATQ
ncbi:hypothetical protein F5J12DRAFT_925896 [Pisolithus orientalis]|uniref:uncharacterized protein n=1 Tax=Pisolithus orientalis TaxID=936130 RepID=UPI0022252E24|nr:uncharacterized protein F5J12DRAFT_925896 [Pisolithus orientalis]KAI6019788.1 hypothetical protein F5J12DRAFT_925896 [Pisolithus orientalis]